MIESLCHATVILCYLVKFRSGQLCRKANLPTWGKNSSRKSVLKPYIIYIVERWGYWNFAMVRYCIVLYYILYFYLCILRLFQVPSHICSWLVCPNQAREYQSEVLFRRRLWILFQRKAPSKQISRENRYRNSSVRPTLQWRRITLQGRLRIVELSSWRRVSEKGSTYEGYQRCCAVCHWQFTIDFNSKYINKVNQHGTSSERWCEFKITVRSLKKTCVEHRIISYLVCTILYCTCMCTILIL